MSQDNQHYDSIYPWINYLTSMTIEIYYSAKEHKLSSKLCKIIEYYGLERSYIAIFLEIIKDKPNSHDLIDNIIFFSYFIHFYNKQTEKIVMHRVIDNYVNNIYQNNEEILNMVNLDAQIAIIVSNKIMNNLLFGCNNHNSFPNFKIEDERLVFLSKMSSKVLEQSLYNIIIHNLRHSKINKEFWKDYIMLIMKNKIKPLELQKPFM